MQLSTQNRRTCIQVGMGGALLSASKRLIRINLWQKSMLDRGILQIFARGNDRGLGLWYILFFVTLDISYTSSAKVLWNRWWCRCYQWSSLPWRPEEVATIQFNKPSAGHKRLSSKSSQLRQTNSFQRYSGLCHAGSKESFQTTLYGVKADLSARVRGASTCSSQTGDSCPICSWQLLLNICHMSNAMKCFWNWKKSRKWGSHESSSKHWQLRSLLWWECFEE